MTFISNSWKKAFLLKRLVLTLQSFSRDICIKAICRKLAYSTSLIKLMLSGRSMTPKTSKIYELKYIYKKYIKYMSSIWKKLRAWSWKLLSKGRNLTRWRCRSCIYGKNHWVRLLDKKKHTQFCYITPHGNSYISI